MDKNTDNRLGLNIRGLRKAYGETQEDLAFAIGESGKTTISNYEVGSRVPQREVLRKIAKHYHITEEELLNGDYSEMKIMFDVNIFDIENGKNMIDKTFPIILSENAMMNGNFKKAYELHMELYDEMLYERNVSEEKIEECVKLYEAASNEDVIEATANHLGWMAFWDFIYNFITPEMLDFLENTSESNLTTKNFLKLGYLLSFEEEVENTNKLSKEDMEEIAEREANMYVDIYLLKKSSEYSDLGDYYLALKYIFGRATSTLSKEMSKALGSELMKTYSMLRNKYAMNFLGEA